MKPKDIKTIVIGSLVDMKTIFDKKEQEKIRNQSNYIIDFFQRLTIEEFQAFKDTGESLINKEEIT
jgi:hypothetical protein